MIEIVLPWPAAKLSSNARGAWQTKEASRKQAKLLGKFYAMQTGQRLPPKTPLGITIEAHPPTNGRHDWDGVVTRLKYWQDGFCDGFGVDDSQIKDARVRMMDKIEGGKVIVRIEELKHENH